MEVRETKRKPLFIWPNKFEWVVMIISFITFVVIGKTTHVIDLIANLVK